MISIKWPLTTLLVVTATLLPPSCKPSPVTVLGIYAGMDCPKFAAVAFPLHQNYKKLANSPEMTGLPAGRLFLTQTSFEDACANGLIFSEKRQDRSFHIATDSGTPIEVEFRYSGFSMSLQSWVNMNEATWGGAGANTAIVDGRLYKGHTLTEITQFKAAADAIIGEALSSLGPPLVEAKYTKYRERNASFWRRGEYLVCKDCEDFFQVRETRRFVEQDLKDSPDVERILEALRKDGAQGL
jgi:hypothetical protein